MCLYKLQFFARSWYIKSFVRDSTESSQRYLLFPISALFVAWPMKLELDNCKFYLCGGGTDPPGLPTRIGCKFTHVDSGINHPMPVEINLWENNFGFNYPWKDGGCKTWVCRRDGSHHASRGPSKKIGYMCTFSGHHFSLYIIFVNTSLWWECWELYYAFCECVALPNYLLTMFLFSFWMVIQFILHSRGSYTDGEKALCSTCGGQK